MDDYMRPVAREEAFPQTIEMAKRLLALEQEAGGAVRVVRDAEALDDCLDDGGLAAVLHLEGAEPIGAGLDEVEALHDLGLRSLGIAWSRPNAFGHGVPFEFPGSPDQGPGLTDAGQALVRACNTLGIVVDVSHLNEQGFWDVAATTEAPLVASHSNAHALCESPHNLTDDQLKAVGESGGLVGINFCVGFLREDGADDPDTPLSTIAVHAAHAAEVAGVDAVALGSDFDGATMPNELSDAARLPALFDALREIGFAEDELAQISLGNWRRVLRATWGA